MNCDLNIHELLFIVLKKIVITVLKLGEVIDTQTNPAFDSTFRQSVDCGFFVKSPKVYDNSVIVLFTF